MYRLTKKEIDIERWEYELRQRDGHPTIMADWWARSLHDYFASEANINVPAPDFLITGSARMYTNKQKKREIINAIKGTIKPPFDYLSYVKEQTLARVDELEHLTSEIKEKSTKANLEKGEVLKLFQRFDKQLLVTLPWAYIPWYITEENMITDPLQERLSPYKDELEEITDFQTALATVITPHKEAEFQKEQRAFYELVEIAQAVDGYINDASFLKKANEYLNTFGWINTFIALPKELLQFNELVERIESARENNSLAEYQEQQEKKQKNKDMQDDLMKIITHDDELSHLVKWAQEYGWLLTASVEQILRATAHMLPLYKQLAQKLEVPYELWVYHTTEEIVDALEGNRTVDETVLQERKQSYVYMMQDGMPALAAGETARELTNWIDNNVGAQTDLAEIKGQPAQQGQATGPVFIAYTPDEARNLVDGDILVCPMTSPDYVPAMKRAAAIITDEGGLLSHAAIMSRELGKPCIVGTKNATHMLQNRDVVEINAHNGTIKKITKPL